MKPTYQDPPPKNINVIYTQARNYTSNGLFPRDLAAARIYAEEQVRDELHRAFVAGWYACERYFKANPEAKP